MTVAQGVICRDCPSFPGTASLIAARSAPSSRDPCCLKSWGGARAPGGWKRLCGLGVHHPTAPSV